VRLQRWITALRWGSDSAVPVNGSTASPVMSGLRRGIKLGTQNIAFGAAVLFGALALYTVPKFSLGDAFHWGFYVHNQRNVAEDRAIALVPDGVTVQVPNRMGPHLSGRDTVLLWDGYGHTPIFTPWIIAIDDGRNFGWLSVQQEKDRVDLLLKHGYVIVGNERGIIVMHAPNAPGSGTTPSSG
jgi:hypothetical protein